MHLLLLLIEEGFDLMASVDLREVPTQRVTVYGYLLNE